MRTLRALSTILFTSAIAATLSASCTKKDDTSLGDAGSGGKGSGAQGGMSIVLTGGSAGAGGSSGSSAGGTSNTAGAAGDDGTSGNDGVEECKDGFTGLDATCGGAELEAELRTVNMLLVIDKSGSMTDPLSDDDSKWTALKASLGTALGNVKREMNFGLILYPYSLFHVIDEASCAPYCCDGATDSSAVIVPVSPGIVAAREITDRLDDTAPGGGTPTASALAAALDYFTHGDGALLSGNNYVLLATDGGPNCNADLDCDADTCTTNLDGQCLDANDANCCRFDDTKNQCLDDDSVMAKLEALTAAGISTFVVGLPGTKQYSEYLDRFAEAGGVANSAGDTKYYAVAEDAGVEGLTSVFESITTQLVRSCEIPLTDVPSQPKFVNVAIDCDVVPPESDDGSGWEYDSETNPTAVIVKGPACDRLQENGAKRVDVLFGCPTVR